MGKQMVRFIVGAACVVAAGIAVPEPAAAIGCFSGGAVGAAGGHVAGHHAVIGALGGCIAGHYAHKRQQANAAQEEQRQYQQGYQSGHPDWNQGRPDNTYRQQN
ncbi:MAG: hypothetical protein ACRYG8_45790 [Janthinobacterium lividum]